MNEEDIKPDLSDQHQHQQQELNDSSTKPSIDHQLESNDDQLQPEPGPSRTNDQNRSQDLIDDQSLANLTCAICLGAPSPLAVTQCGHVACGGCLAASLASQVDPLAAFDLVPNNETNGKCPVCRAMLVGGWGIALRGAILKMG